MYVQLFCKVPEGNITSIGDINKFLGKIYNRNVSGYPDRPLPLYTSNDSSIPYWRVVSSRGVLENGRGGTKEMQKEQLTKEGLPVVQRGNQPNSYKVENYKDYFFNFNMLKIVNQ